MTKRRRCLTCLRPAVGHERFCARCLAIEKRNGWPSLIRKVLK